MSGKCNGVKTIIMNIQTLALYTHCGAHQDGLRKSCIKTTLVQYSCIIDVLKEYKELDYITNDLKYIANLLLKI